MDETAYADRFPFILHNLNLSLRDGTRLFTAVITTMHSGLRKIRTNAYRTPGKLFFVSLKYEPILYLMYIKAPWIRDRKLQTFSKMLV